MLSNISIYKENSKFIWQKASEFLIDWFRLYHNITQKTLLLLSGGSCVNIYEDLAKWIESSGLDFSFLAIAQVDERKFKMQNAKCKITIQNLKIKRDINANLIEETGLWKACKDKKVPYYLVSQEGTLEQSTNQYNEIIERLFKEYVYKIAVLGIGEDGHIAGLLPGYEKVWNSESMVVGYENKGKFKRRISLTPKAFEQIDQAIIIAAGEKKRKAIIKVFLDKKAYTLNDYPALIIRRIQKSDLFTDIGDLPG